MTTTGATLEPQAPEAAPETPKLHPVRWLRENLFSSVWSSILTIVLLVVIVVAIRGVLGFIFAPERQWASITTNSRLYAVVSYPTDLGQFVRTWISLDIVAALIGLSLAAWEVAGRVSVSQIARALIFFGVALATVAVLAPWSASATTTGLIIAAVFILVPAVVMRAMGRDAAVPRIPILGVLLFLLVAAMASLWIAPQISERIVIADSTRIPLVIASAIAVGAYFVGRALTRAVSAKALRPVMVGLWLLSIPTIYLVVLRDPVFDTETIKQEDLRITGWLLVMGVVLLWILTDPPRRDLLRWPVGAIAVAAVAIWIPPIGDVLAPTDVARVAVDIVAGFVVLAYVFSGLEGGTKKDAVGGVTSGLVVLAAVVWFPSISSIVERSVFRWIVAALFIAAGAYVVYLLTRLSRGSLELVIGSAVLLGVALLLWFVDFNDVVPWIKARVLLGVLAMFALAAPSFGGSDRSRKTLVGAYVAATLVTAFFLAVGQASTGLVRVSGTGAEIPVTTFVEGFLLTMLLASAGILLSFPLGVLLALGRTSSLPIFRLMSTAYIEVIRGVPLITVLFFGALFLPLFLPAELEIEDTVKALIAIALFAAAYLAENVRGGLQSIPKGQYEAAGALGMTTVQTTIFISLPQALRAVIPALVGQVIALFKDTSLVAIIGLADLLLVAQKLVPNQPAFVGSARENLMFVALVYWLFTFSFSRASQRLERKLGVGER